MNMEKIKMPSFGQPKVSVAPSRGGPVLMKEYFDKKFLKDVQNFDIQLNEEILKGVKDSDERAIDKLPVRKGEAKMSGGGTMAIQ